MCLGEEIGGLISEIRKKSEGILSRPSIYSNSLITEKFIEEKYNHLNLGYFSLFDRFYSVYKNKNYYKNVGKVKNMEV